MNRIDLAAIPVAGILRLLEEFEIPVREITVSKPSLDEVFFRHTGRKLRDSQESSPAGTCAPHPR